MKDLLVKKIMSTELITVSQFDKLSKAKEIFDKGNIHHLPVMQEGKLIGILSNVDLERSKHGKTLFTNHNLDEYNESMMKINMIGMIMTENVECISPNASLYDAYLVFKNNAFRALPVMEDEKLMGIITPMDFLDYFFKENK